MNKFWIKTLAIISELVLIGLYLATPILIGMLIYNFLKPEGYIKGILFFIIWFVLCFLTYPLGLFIIKVLRTNFDIIDKYLEIIDAYKKNKQ